MLFGKLLEVGNEPDENNLQGMEQELRQGIGRAKEIVAACKLNS